MAGRKTCKKKKPQYFFRWCFELSELQPSEKTENTQTCVFFILTWGWRCGFSCLGRSESLCLLGTQTISCVCLPSQSDDRTSTVAFECVFRHDKVFIDLCWDFFFFFRCSGFHSWCNKRVTGQMLFIYLEMICVCQWALRKEDLSLIRKLEDVLGHLHAALLYIMQTQGLSVFHPHCWSNYWWLNSLGYVFAGIVHSELWTIQLLTKMHLMSNTKLQTQASTSSHEQAPDMYLVHYRCRAECGQLFHTHKRSKNSSN